MAVAVWNNEEEWREWVDQYAADLHLLTSLGLSAKARSRLVRLAGGHNLLPSQLAMWLLNAYLESAEAQEQARQTEEAGWQIRDAKHRLDS